MTAPAPHNIEAEQAVLGAILLNNAAFDRVRLDETDFFDPVHGRIFAACKQEIESGRLVSPVTMKGLMADDEGLQSRGGSKYLLNLAEAVISLSSMRDYCRVLRGLTARREIIRLAEEARAAAMNPGEDPRATVEFISGALEATISASEEKPSFYTFRRSLTDAMERSQARFDETAVHLPTGITGLDEMLGGGLEDGRLYVLAGDTGMGKSTIAVYLIDQIARRRSGDTPGRGVMVASLEMAHYEAGHRWVSMRASEAGQTLTYQKIATGCMEEEQFRRALEAARIGEDLPITVSDENVRNVVSMRAAFRRAAKHLNSIKCPPRLILIDHLHIMQHRGYSNRTEEVNECANICKEIAKEYGCAVVLLAQLNRESVKGDIKRPSAYSIKQSGGVEQIADAVILPFREAHYMRRELIQMDRASVGYSECVAQYDRHKETLELIVDKNRSGRTGTAYARIDVSTNRIWNPEGGSSQTYDGFL